MVEQFAKLGVESSRRPVLGQARNAAIPPALYFQPGPTPGDWAYLDIAACYGTLLGHWPLDTRYVQALDVKAGAHLYRPAGPTLPTGDLIACKDLRLAVWGTLRGGLVQWRSPKGWGSTHMADRLTRPGLTGLVLVAVHEIAWRAVHDFGAREWLTDAAILPLNRAFGFLDYLRGWGLRARIKGVGATELTGLAAYRVGDKRSATFGRVTPAVNRLLEPLEWRSV